MLVTTARRRKEEETQMFFSWGEPSKRNQQKIKPAPVKPVQVPAPETALPVKDETHDIREICRLLHQIAQRHVPRTHFQDREALIQCAKLLQTQNVSLDIADDLKSHVADFNPVVVTHAPQYRLMRNRAIAALATVADLSNRAPSKGSPEYQRGMRDGFQTASDIAIFFLEDIETAYEFRR